jgi:hypothetical protein
LLNIFENGSNSIRKAAPSKKSEPELFLEEPKSYQTGPKFYDARGKSSMWEGLKPDVIIILCEIQ